VAKICDKEMEKSPSGNSEECKRVHLCGFSLVWDFFLLHFIQSSAGSLCGNRNHLCYSDSNLFFMATIAEAGAWEGFFYPSLP
jgi:hypothetical protein